MKSVEIADLSHSLFPERDIISSEGDPRNHLENISKCHFLTWAIENLLGVTLHDHPTVDHLIQGQHNHLEE